VRFRAQQSIHAMSDIQFGTAFRGHLTIKVDLQKRVLVNLQFSVDRIEEERHFSLALDIRLGGGGGAMYKVKSTPAK